MDAVERVWQGRAVSRRQEVCWAGTVAVGLMLVGEVQGAPALERVYGGACDASAGAALSDAVFAAASDEQNVIRVHAFEPAGLPLRTVKLRDFLGEGGQRGEADIEGAARVGSRVYWITSHGRNKDGEERGERRRLFATEVIGEGLAASLEAVGRPYTTLVADMVADPRLGFLRLDAAAARAPQAEGGLNIESLAAWGEGGLLIGFRSPLSGGRAVLVPLENPAAVVAGRAAARFGAPILLGLGGRGIRDMVLTPAGYYLVAGSPGSGGQSRIYRWKGGADQPWRVRELDLGGFNAEALVFARPGGKPQLLVLSDDGRRLVGGVECAELKEASARSFRGRSLVLDLGN